MLSIDDNLRSQRTAPQTAAGLQAEFGIRVHFTRPDPDQFLNRIKQAIRPPEVT